MTHRRVRTVMLFNDAGYCGHINPDDHFDEEPFKSMEDEDHYNALAEYQDNHISSGDIDICLQSPAGMGIEEWSRTSGWDFVQDEAFSELHVADHPFDRKQR